MSNLPPTDLSKESLPNEVTANHERKKVGEKVKNDLNPLAYATAYRDTGGNLEALKCNLVSAEYQQKFDVFKQLVENKAQKNFYEKTLKEGIDWTKKTAEETQKFFGDVVKSLEGDPDVENHWNDIVSFDQTNVKVSGAVLMYDYLGGGMQSRIANEYQGAIDDNKKGFKKLSGKAWAAAKPVVLTNIAMQPAVLSTVGAGVDLTKNILYKGGEVFKNVVAGVTQGDLLDEMWHVGRDGDPIEYLWNGRTIKDRKMDNLKDPKILQTPEKLKPFMNGETAYYFYAMDQYAHKPEILQTKIPSMAEFSYRSIKSAMSDAELQNLVHNLESGKWDDQNVRRALSMSVSGALLQFFLETAQPSDRQKFLNELKMLEHRRVKPGGFTTADLEKKFPGINDHMTKKDKGLVRSALSSGLSGITFGAFIFTQLFSKLLFSVSKDPFQFFGELNDEGPERVIKRYKKNWKIKNNQLQKFSDRERDDFYSFTKKKQYDKKFKLLAKKDGILTEKEVENLLSSKMTNKQRRQVSQEVDEFLKERRRPNIKSDEFWELPTLKKLKSKELREQVFEN